MSVQSNKKIGYALGGGAARGLSHIGVLKVLEEPLLSLEERLKNYKFLNQYQFFWET